MCRHPREATAIAMETSTTPQLPRCAVAIALRTRMLMASAMTKTTAMGALDACGVCNGPGEIYECGCSDIPAGDCDCDGNQLDALEVCGGDCAADEDADGICDDEDDRVGALTLAACATDPGEIYECGCAPTFQPATATAMETSLTPWKCAEVIALRTTMLMASVTTKTLVSVSLTNVACATVLERFTSADALTSLLAIATARATNSMPSMFAVVIVLRTPMQMAFVTTKMTALEHSMLAASAMVPARFTSVDVPTSPRPTATARATNSTPSMFAVVIVLRMPMQTVFVMMKTTVSVHTMSAGSATGLVLLTHAAVMISLKATATAMEINWMPSMSAVVIVLLTPMPTGFVTTRMTALEHSMLAASAMAPARFTSVDALTSPQGTATARATSSTR